MSDQYPTTSDTLAIGCHELTSMVARQADLLSPLRQLHRHILNAFLTTGVPPDRRALRTPATDLGLDIDIALRQLSDVDLVHIDAGGTVTVAYPFSGRPTGHTVHLDGAPPVQAMCAIDALGIPLMAGHDAIITSTDPTTGEPIRVELSAGTWRWEPAETVVLLAHTGGCGPSAECVCPLITFHTTAEHAATYLHEQGADGTTLDQDQAVRRARQVFGDLLAG
jgi:alkylmercury lyase